ncbi:nucleoside deaminase [bacterium]|nr:nucleoside deaminase [bacterium]
MLNIDFMKKAIDCALKSGKDIPVGAVIVKDGKIIAESTNTREKEQRTTAHAEILAIEEANKKLNNWRLDDCDLYVTLEPCPMCAGAIIQARIKNIYYGAYDIINGAFGSKSDMTKIMQTNICVKGGILEEECTKLIKKYFEDIRKC